MVDRTKIEANQKKEVRLQRRKGEKFTKTGGNTRLLGRSLVLIWFPFIVILLGRRDVSLLIIGICTGFGFGDRLHFRSCPSACILIFNFLFLLLLANLRCHMLLLSGWQATHCSQKMVRSSDRSIARGTDCHRSLSVLPSFGNAREHWAEISKLPNWATPTACQACMLFVI